MDGGEREKKFVLWWENPWDASYNEVVGLDVMIRDDLFDNLPEGGLRSEEQETARAIVGASNKLKRLLHLVSASALFPRKQLSSREQSYDWSSKRVSPNWLSRD